MCTATSGKKSTGRVPLTEENHMMASSEMCVSTQLPLDTAVAVCDAIRRGAKAAVILQEHKLEHRRQVLALIARLDGTGRSCVLLQRGRSDAESVRVDLTPTGGECGVPSSELAKAPATTTAAAPRRPLPNLAPSSQLLEACALLGLPEPGSSGTESAQRAEPVTDSAKTEASALHDTVHNQDLSSPVRLSRHTVTPVRSSRHATLSCHSSPTPPNSVRTEGKSRISITPRLSRQRGASASSRTLSAERGLDGLGQ